MPKLGSTCWICIDCTTKKSVSTSQGSGESGNRINISWHEASGNKGARAKSSIQRKRGRGSKAAHGGQRPLHAIVMRTLFKGTSQNQKTQDCGLISKKGYF